MGCSNLTIEAGGYRRSGVLSGQRGVAFLIFLTAFLLCCFTSAYEVASMAALLVFAAFFVYLLYDTPKLLVKYLPFVFGVVTNVVGCAVCEFSTVYLDELNATSGYVGSLPLLIFSRSLFMMIVVVLDLKFGVDKSLSANGSAFSSQTVKWIDLAAVGCVVLFAILFAEVAFHPAFLEGMNRFTYQGNYGASGPLRTLAGYLVIIPILSLRYGSKAVGLAGVALYLSNLLWTGNKFGAFFTVMCVFAIVYYSALLGANEEKVRSVVLRGFVCVLALVVFALAVFSSMSSENPVEYLEHRVAEQGQLWWATYSRVDGVTHVDEFPDEMDGALHGDENIRNNVGAHYGIYKIMYLVAPANTVNSHLNAGARFTEGGYASSYYYFGSFGPVVFAACMGLLAFAVMNLLLWSVVHGRLLCCVVLLRLLALVRVASGMAIVTGLLEPVSIASYCLVVLVLLMAANGADGAWRRRSPTSDTLSPIMMTPEARYIGEHAA